VASPLVEMAMRFGAGSSLNGTTTFRVPFWNVAEMRSSSACSGSAMRR
jgi:hypothetical protein